MDPAAIVNACAVCGGCGCVVVFDPVTKQPKITDEICPGCNGAGKRLGPTGPPTEFPENS